MIRIIVGGVLGAIVYFVWGMAVWMFLGLHDSTILELPGEGRTTGILTTNELETGVYVSPYTDNPQEEMYDTESIFHKKYSKGPIYSIYFQKEGEDPMSVRMFIVGFVIDLLAALLAAVMLSSAVNGSCKTYAHRIGFVTGFGIFVGLIGHASYWNWMHFPLQYTTMFILDAFFGWFLVGLIMAAIIRCPKTTTQA